MIKIMFLLYVEVSRHLGLVWFYFSEVSKSALREGDENPGGKVEPVWNT